MPADKAKDPYFHPLVSHDLAPAINASPQDFGADKIAKAYKEAQDIAKALAGTHLSQTSKECAGTVEKVKQNPVYLAFYAFVNSPDLMAMSTEEWRELVADIHARIKVDISSASQVKTLRLKLTPASQQSILEEDRSHNASGTAVSTIMGDPDNALFGAPSAWLTSFSCTFNSMLKTSAGRARIEFCSKDNKDSGKEQDIEKPLALWHSYFELHRHQKQDQHEFWSVAGGLLYAAVVGLSGAAGLSAAVGTGGIALFVAAIALGLIAAGTNLRFTTGNFQAMFADIKQGWREICEKKEWSVKIQFVVASIICLGASFVLGFAAANGIQVGLEPFLALVGAAGHVTTIVSYVAPVVFAITVLINALFFLKAIIDICRLGGFGKVMADVGTNALYDNDKKEVRWLSVAIFVVLVACNAVAIYFQAAGSDAAMKSGVIVDIAEHAARLSLQIISGAGMAVFFLRQSLGFAYSADDMLRNFKLRETFRKFNAGGYLKRNFISISTIVGYISCAAVFASPMAPIALAVLFVGVFVSMMYKKILDRYFPVTSEARNTASGLRFEPLDLAVKTQPKKSEARNTASGWRFEPLDLATKTQPNKEVKEVPQGPEKPVGLLTGQAHNQGIKKYLRFTMNLNQRKYADGDYIDLPSENLSPC